MYNVLHTDTARRFFETAETVLQKKLDRCFAQLAIDPRRHNNVKALKGGFSGYFRFRVGDYRVIYRIDETTKSVIVVEIVNRRDAYE